MATKRSTIKAAVVSMLETITIANGYDLDIGTVFDRRTPIAKLGTLPGVCVVGGFEDKLHTDASGQRLSSYKLPLLELTLLCFDKGDDAEATLETLAGAIEIALEQLNPPLVGQPLGGLGYVQRVDVADIDPFDTTDGIEIGGRSWAIRVLIEYRHKRLEP